MDRVKSILLVEGQTDVDFFYALLRKLGLQNRIEIRPPKEFGFKTDTVSHFPRLIDLLIKQLSANQVNHLGIVADADHVSGGGFLNRWKQLTDCLAKHEYRIPSNPPKLPNLGSIFRHPDLPHVGLWLMPDHKSNGMLEDLIRQAFRKSDPQEALLQYAQTCVDRLPLRLFSQFHQTKAVVFAFLAWQKRPGQTLDITINGDLIDLSSPGIKGFINWLNNVFAMI